MYKIKVGENYLLSLKAVICLRDTEDLDKTNLQTDYIKPSLIMIRIVLLVVSALNG